MKKTLLFLIFLLVLLTPVIAQETLTGSCTKDIDLDCRRSDKVSSDACSVVVSPLQTYTGCSNQQITLPYNTQTLSCGDELSLKIAKYDGAGGWQPLPDSNVISNGDGTGSVTATLNSDATLAVISTSECNFACTENVFDYPDPVLGGSSITLGACGSTIPAITEETEGETCFEKLSRIGRRGPNNAICEQACKNNDNEGPTSDATYCCPTGCVITQGETELTIPDLDLIAPVLPIIRRAECTPTTPITNYETQGEACPTGYDYTGSFKIGNEDDACETPQQTYTGIGRTQNGFVTTSITKGWVDLCVKNELAYIEIARNECLVDHQNTEVLSAEGRVPHYCPSGTVMCEYTPGSIEGKPITGFQQRGNPTITCCPIPLTIQDAEDPIAGEIQSDELGGTFFCPDETPLVYGGRGQTPAFSGDSGGFGINSIFCGSAAGIIVEGNNRATQSPLAQSCAELGPDYAVCGAENEQSGSWGTTRIAGVHCCKIKKTLDTTCKEGYSLAGTIKVNNDNPNRCLDPTLPNTEYAWTQDGRKLISGHVGVCVKTNELETFQNALTLLPTTVTKGTVASQQLPADYSIIGTLTTTSNYEQAIFPTLTPITEGEEPTLEQGTLTLALKANKPLVSFCATPSFVNGSCTEQLCTSTDGTFTCQATTTPEDAIQEYYAYICDFTGCPSTSYQQGISYYGTGNYQICSSTEACGFTSPSMECIDNDGDGVCNDVDCNDNDAAIKPGASEVCDLVDNDCDFAIDEGFDSDGDGITTCALVADCNDNDASISPITGEICGNNVDENCDGESPECPVCENGGTDTDQDGVCSNAGDCNDNDNTIAPGATDICGDGIDQDCDGSDLACAPEPECTPGNYRVCYPTPEDTTYTYHQVCGNNSLWGSCTPDYELGILPPDPAPTCTDGLQLNCPRQYGVCQGSVQTCTSGAWPGCEYTQIEGYSTTEICGDYLDNDCDGSTDEGCSCITGQNQTCGSTIGTCSTGTQQCANATWQTCTNNVGPLPELYLDQQDNDCDGSVDEGFECGQTYGIGFNRTCGEANTGICRNGIQTCTDQLFQGITVFGICQNSVNPEQEICDTIDNDCDGSVDEGCACTTGQTASCGLGVGICGTGHQDCVNGTWSVCLDVTEPRQEICTDTLDNDCDGTVNEACACEGNQTTTTCSKQLGVCNGTVAYCVNGEFAECTAVYEALADYELVETSCEDGLDNDCDGLIDDDDSSCTSTSTDTCEDGTPVGQCVSRGSSAKYCDSFGNLVDKCSTCDPSCDPGTSVCDINGACRDLDSPDTGGPGPGPTESCNYNDVCDIGEPTSCPDCQTGAPPRPTEESSLWIWIILILLLIGIGILGYIFYKKRKEQKPKQRPGQITPQQIQNITRPTPTIQELKQTKEEDNKQELHNYITRSLQQGKTPQELKELCKKAGWNEQDINEVLGKTKQPQQKRPVTQDLQTYAEHAFIKGAKDTEIKQTLLKAGWKPADIDKAILNAKLTLARNASKKPLQPVRRNADDEAYAEQKLQELLGQKEKKKQNSSFETTNIQGKEEYILKGKKGKKK